MRSADSSGLLLMSTKSRVFVDWSKRPCAIGWDPNSDIDLTYANWHVSQGMACLNLTS